MHLCPNRPEGFSPMSDFSVLPTSCFIDTILLPLPTWLAILFIPVLLTLSYMITRSSSRHFNPSTIHLRPSTRTRRSCGLKITEAVYYILILANLLMAILEIVRLAILEFGIGLLPFILVGLLLGAALHLVNPVVRLGNWEFINAIVWLGGIIMSIIQCVELSQLPGGALGRKGSKYPVSDQIIDVGVMAGVYALLLILEAVIGSWRRKLYAEEVARVNAKGIVVESIGSGGK
ncbi:hypothetical protein BP5796_03736 [Coleophoma crateriformis]|uniref:MARVEL domain-containing protein n=1 Tax=Coleophoma crateriformis TaxID=565419 RepID=A0A3D8SGV6_9HELO|nr:hypothetical protein BP5796_03736 [Coleophoma crateriformis]